MPKPYEKTSIGSYVSEYIPIFALIRSSKIGQVNDSEFCFAECKRIFD